MSDKSMDRPQPQRPRTPRIRPGSFAAPPLLRTVLCFALLGLCAAGHRPYQRGERRPHHSAQEPSASLQRDDGAQRVHFPQLSDGGAQRVRYPWVQDRGQVVQYPAPDESADDAGIEVNRCERDDGRRRCRAYSVGRGPRIGRGTAPRVVC